MGQGQTKHGISFAILALPGVRGDGRGQKRWLQSLCLVSPLHEPTTWSSVTSLQESDDGRCVQATWPGSAHNFSNKEKPFVRACGQAPEIVVA